MDVADTSRLCTAMYYGICELTGRLAPQCVNLSLGVARMALLTLLPWYALFFRSAGLHVELPWLAVLRRTELKPPRRHLRC